MLFELCRPCRFIPDPCWLRQPVTFLAGLAICHLAVLPPLVAQDTNASSVSAQGDDWPAFLGPSGDSKSTATKLDLDWSSRPPTMRWSRRLGDSYGIGSVSRGRYFQFDYLEGKQVLLCLQAESGEELWRFAYDSSYQDLYNYSSGPRTSPVIDDDRVYIYGVDGKLFCLGTDEGKVRWECDTAARFGVVQNFFGVGSTPIIYQDLLIVMVGGSPAEDQTIAPGQLDRVTGNGSGVVAFDKRTGAVRYQFSDELASYSSPRLVQRNDRAWCFMFMRGGLLAFNPANGVQDFFYPWRARTLESVNASTPVVWRDRVFISETYGPGSSLLRFSPGKYEVLWSDDARRREKAMQTHWNTAIYVDGFLYGSSGRHSYTAELRCIDAESGQVRWSQPGLTRSSLLYVDQQLICLGEDGALRVLAATPEAYRVKAEFIPLVAGATRDTPQTRLLKYPAWAAPILAQGKLYVRGADAVACYELSRN